MGCKHDGHVMTLLHMSHATRYMRVGVWAKTLVPLPVELDHQVGLRFTLLLGLVVPLRYPRCIQELYYKEKAHGPPHLKYCGTGDYLCRGYNETVITDGWFYDLADLDQSHPFVRKFLKDWVKYMVSQIKLGRVYICTIYIL